MKILYYEIRKNFLKPSIILCLIIFSFINLYKVNEAYETYMNINYYKIGGPTFQKGYKEVYNNKLKGEITKEKIDFVMNYYEQMARLVAETDFSKEYDESRYTGYIFGDRGLFKDGIIADMEYNYMYGYDILEIVKKSKENIKFYSKVGNNYEVKKNKKIIDIYENRNLKKLSLTRGIEYYLRYDFSSLLIILLIILGLARVFCSENETQMIQLIATCENKSQTVRMKFLASFGYIMSISLYFYVMDFITIYIITGTDCFSSPLYALKFFRFTPLNMSVTAFLALDFIMKTLVLVLLGAIVLLFSSYFRKTLIVFTLSIISISGLILLNNFLPTVINPLALITNYNILNQFESLNIFGFCILKYQAWIAVTIIWYVILYIIVRRRAIKWC